VGAERNITSQLLKHVGAVTRVVRWAGLPAVVRVKTRADVIVAIPRGLPHHDVLDLASLVLTGHEYQEFRHRIEPAPGPGPGRGTRPAHRA
jgi:hypothetical protein